MPIENVQFQQGRRPGDDLIASAGAAAPQDGDPVHPLDSDEAVAQLEQLQDWHSDEREKQRYNRYQMALDEDYYDGLQIDENDLATYLDRRQAPIVYNRVALVVDWLLGTEVHTRFDWKVRPRTPDDADGAQIKTSTLKYVSDVNRTGDKRSDTFQDQIVAGLGLMEHGITTDPAAEPIFNRKESWRNVWYDSRSIEDDWSDARYLFRQRWVDLDFALAMFPTRADILNGNATGGNGERRFGTDEDEDVWYEGQNLSRQTDSQEDSRYVTAGSYTLSANRRQRVRLMEAWWRVPAARNVIRGASFDGQVMDPTNPGHVAAIQNGESVIVSNIGMQMQHAIFCDAGMLTMGPMVYRHNRFPIVPQWCKRRKRDRAPYGIVRAMRDAQDDFNKRRSKALWLLSTRGVIMDEGAVDAEQIETMRAEVARPDFMLTKRRGTELKIVDGAELVPAQLSFAEGDLQHIEAAGGVTNEQLGIATNAISGKAIQARQLQGAVTNAPIFSRARMAFELSGQINLSLIEQFYTWPRIIRLAGERGSDEFHHLNQPQPQQDGQDRYLNDVTRTEADFVVDAQDWHATARQALFDSLSALFVKMPEAVQQQNLDLLLELVDDPSIVQMVARIRKQNGIPDPDGPKTPEDAAAEQQMLADQQQAKEVQQRIMLAGAAEAEANAAVAAGKVDLNKANALKFLANVDALKGQGMQAQITGLYEAIQAAMAIILTPQVAPIADAIALSAGFHDENAAPIFPNAPVGGPPPNVAAMTAQPRLEQRNAPPPIATQPAVNSSIGPAAPVRAAGAQAGIHTLRPDGAQP